jgi:hypothetical protein
MVGSAFTRDRKWIGAHWRLVSLVELGIPAGERQAVRAAETVLEWLTGEEHRSSILTVGGLVRRHASQEGNALAVCSRLGSHWLIRRYPDGFAPVDSLVSIMGG